MRRTLATAGLLALALAVLGASTPALAGGWDSLRFRRDHYLVGEVARARTEFFAGELEGSGPLDGRTYYAYLLPSSRDELFGMIDAPRVPSDAIRLGVLEVNGQLRKPDGYPYGIAALSFTVPDVPSGDYSIGFCDDPCTYETVGWLAWGSIRIVHTPLEGRLLRANGRLTVRLDDLGDEMRRELARVEGDAAERTGLLTRQLQTARMALRVRDALEIPSAGAVAERAVPVRGNGGPPWWLGLLAGATIGIAGTWALGLRRGDREAVRIERRAEPAHELDREPDREPAVL